jgi:hypothetical protein
MLLSSAVSMYQHQLSGEDQEAALISPLLSCVEAWRSIGLAVLGRPLPWAKLDYNGAASRRCFRSGFLGTLHVQSSPRYRVIHLDEDEESPLRRGKGLP